MVLRLCINWDVVDAPHAGMPSPPLLDYLKAVQTLAGGPFSTRLHSRCCDRALPSLPAALPPGLAGRTTLAMPCIGVFASTSNTFTNLAGNRAPVKGGKGQDWLARNG